MNNHDIDILNNTLKKLIDSEKGYRKMAEVAGPNFPLQAEFSRRANERFQLIEEFKTEVRNLGGEPNTDGSVLGSIHRGFSEFVALFRDDTKLALSEVDDGEEHLGDFIKDKIDDDADDQAMLPVTRSLMLKALASARDGERFADSLEDAA